MSASHVADAEEETVDAVPKTDNRLTTEHHRVRSVLRSGELREDQSGHQGLDEDAAAGLDHEEENSVSTVGLDDTRSISDCVLGLDGEQKSGEKVVDPRNARLPGGAVGVVMIPVRHGY